MGADERDDVSLRILAEHARGMAFLVSDGVFPSNEGRGYVLRRIIRRAVRHAELLGVSHPVLSDLVASTSEVMGEAYPELVRDLDSIQGVVAREEERFRQTIATGTTILDTALEGLGDGDTLTGELAFSLHDTHGFPLELTREIAEERGVAVDEAAFAEAMAEQRRRAKAARKEGSAGGDEVWIELLAEVGPTEFTGREEPTSKATVLALVDGSLVLDRTPFYAESGGQVGDTGEIRSDTGRAAVLDTFAAAPGLVRHVLGDVEGELLVGQEVVASIDADRRAAIRRNHTATHLAHWALRQVLGDHVKQQGSLVAPDRLRFDFSHYEALTPEQIAEVEHLVNADVLDNHLALHYETTKAHAEEIGAIAFFGDKYGDVVRVLEAGPHSTELCGGTHVRALGDIGAFTIVSESSIGSNLRRIEATTGFGPVERLRHDENVIARAAEVLGVAHDDVVGALERQLGELKELRAEVRAMQRRAATGRAGELAECAVDGAVVARVDGVARDDLRDLALAVRDRPGVDAVVLGGAPEPGGGVAIISAVTPASGLHASELIGDAARAVKGGTGRSPELAMAGGKEVAALDEALDLVRDAVLAARSVSPTGEPGAG
jgi:alanyl-tRNA synthetase